MSRERKPNKAPTDIARLNRELYIKTAKEAGKSADEVLRRIAGALDTLPMSDSGKRKVFDQWLDAVRRVYGEAETGRALDLLALAAGGGAP